MQEVLAILQVVLYNEKVKLCVASIPQLSQAVEEQIMERIFTRTTGGLSNGSSESIIAFFPELCAGAIAGVIREKKMVEVQAVGAGAASQAVKAIAIARGYLAPIGVDLICIPAFANIQIDGEERTAIKLICEER